MTIDRIHRAHAAIAALLVTLAIAPARAADPPAAPAAAPTQEAPADSTAPAAPKPVDPRAAELKKAGDTAMDSLRYADAFAAYSDAYAISQDPALLYNMARALQALNRFPEALAKFEAFDAAAPPELKKRVPRLQALIAEVRQKVSTLEIQSNVSGARILVRGTIVGKTPLAAPLKLLAGKAEIEIEAEGYFPFHRSIDLPGGGQAVVSADLFSRATTGILSVRASAPNSEVFVDGKRVGIAPVETIVPGGAHRIVVKNPDFREHLTSATVVAGERKDVAVTLAPPSIATRWWFWTGLGVVVAAGAGVTAALLTERPADVGDILPGQVRAPARVGPGFAPVMHPLFTF